MNLAEFFEDLYEYHFELNQKFLDYLIQQEDYLNERCHHLISHMVMAHKLWNERMDGKPFIDPFVVLPLKELIELNQENHNKTLEVIKLGDFDKMFTYTTARGDEYGNSIRQILFQVANHFTYHRGQLNAELRNIGLNPIPSDYIFKRRHKLN